MSEQADWLRQRTFQFALDVIELTRSFPATDAGRIVGRQLARSATSVGANYRAACRARSHADFTAKIGVVAEESDESQYWLNIAAGAKLTSSERLPRLQHEATELCAIFSRAVGTARLNASTNRRN
jgi:four helix bundle protein